MAFGHLYVFFKKQSHRSSAYFLIRLFCFFWCWVAYAVCIFCKLSPCWLYYLWIFSCILWAVFLTFSWIPLLCKILSVWLGPTVIFTFVSFALGGWSKKILLQLMSEGFTALCLVCKSLSQLSLSVCSAWSSFVDLCVALRLS